MDNLRLLREATGLSQQKLADYVNLTQQKVHQYENGIYEPDIATLKALADFFDTSVDFLIGRVNIKRKIEPVGEYALNAEEQVLIDKYRRLLPNHRRSLALFLDTFEDK